MRKIIAKDGVEEVCEIRRATSHILSALNTNPGMIYVLKRRMRQCSLDLSFLYASPSPPASPPCSPFLLSSLLEAAHQSIKTINR